MAIYTNTTGSAQLKSYFETGDIPSSANFTDLIDSFALYDGTLPLISGSSISTGSFAVVHARKLVATGAGYLGGNDLVIEGHLIPKTDGTYNLGSASLAWNNIHTATASIGHMSSSLIPVKNNIYDLGSSINEFKDLYIDGTGYIDTLDSFTTTHITASGAISASGNLSTTGNLTAGASTLTSVVTSGNISSSGNLSATGHITASGNISASGNLSVTGTATIGTLSVSALTNNVSITGISSSNQLLNVSGTIVPHATNTFDLGSSALLWRNIYATSVSSSLVSSSINKADTVLTTTIGAINNETTNAYINTLTVSQINASGSATGQVTVSGSLVPGDNTSLHNLGTASKAWNDLHIEGIGYINHLSSSNNSSFISSSVSIIPGTDNKYDLGSATREWANLHVEGTASIGILANITHNTISSSASLVPYTDNIFDLGSTDKEWKDLYIDGTANIDTLLADTASIGRLGTNLVPTTHNVYSLGSDDFKFRDMYLGGTLYASSFVSSSGNQHIIGYVSASTLIATHITASGNITASNLVLSSNITASGNISASGTITSLSGSFSHIVGNSPITVQDPITFQSDITSSGNISASGDIFTNTLNVSNIITNHLTASGNISSSGNLLTTGHITASSNISASGTIYGANLIATSLKNNNNENLIRYHAPSTSIRVGVHTGNTHPLLLQGHVTASGNISASGDLIGDNLQLGTGGITTTNTHIAFNGTTTAMSFANPTTISVSTILPTGHKAVLWVDNANPSVTINSGINYTVQTGGNLSMVNLDKLSSLML
tara:strand:- start:757 stop:3108 length:2352 start_codon:yes stop_codon:yes gene_type:complete